MKFLLPPCLLLRTSVKCNRLIDNQSPPPFPLTSRLNGTKWITKAFKLNVNEVGKTLSTWHHCTVIGHFKTLCHYKLSCLVLSLLTSFRVEFLTQYCKYFFILKAIAGRVLSAFVAFCFTRAQRSEWCRLDRFESEQDEADSRWALYLL